MNDHDILLKLDRDVCWMKKVLSNHLKHHWAITLAACTAATGGLVTSIILILRM